MRQCPALLIAAPASGQGKTTVINQVLDQGYQLYLRFGKKAFVYAPVTHVDLKVSQPVPDTARGDPEGFRYVANGPVAAFDGVSCFHG